MWIKKFLKSITGIAHLEYMKELQEERIDNLTKMLLRERDFQELKVMLDKKNKEIKQAEKSYEEIIDQQYEELQKLRTQLAATTDHEGKFYVFNPLQNKPRKIYDNYAAALEDAKAVSKISGGQKILVLKIISGIEIKEKIEDYSLNPEELNPEGELPF